MKIGNRTILGLLVCLLVLTLGTPAWAGSHARLEGRLSQGDAVVLSPHSSVTLDAGQGIIRLEAGAIRAVRDARQGGFLDIEAYGLEPGARYLVLSGRTPVYAFTAGADGRFSQRVTDRVHIGTTPMIPHSGRSFASVIPDFGVIVLGSEVSEARRVDSNAKCDGCDGMNSTPLCSDDQMVRGEAMVYDGMWDQGLAVYADGLEPGLELTVIADGILVGSAPVDDWGSFDFLAGSGWDADVPLPDELDPVTDIDEILVVTADQTPVLYGSFEEPCDGSGGGGGGGGDDGHPVDGGSISICGTDTGMPTGWMDWVLYDDGTEVASVMAYEMPENSEIGVVFDSVAIGSEYSDDWGDFYVAFSSDPWFDELPLPADAPPLDQVETVELHAGGEVVGSGTDGEDCGWIDPPEPVDEDSTDLCPTSEDSFAWGHAHWMAFDDGNEAFGVLAGGFEAGQTLELIVDGVDLGAYEASDWGEIALYFSSDPDGGFGGGGWGDPMFDEALPLPDEIRPVSSIDAVSFVDENGDAVVAGSFVEGCDDIPDPPDPPQIVDEDFTDLCPTSEDSYAWGGTGWIVFDDGNETFGVYAGGFEAGQTLELIVDGVDLGAYEASDRGEIDLLFSTDPDGGWGPFAGHGDGHGGMDGEVLPLPDEIRPVSSIDAVSFVDENGDAVVAGSFVEGCDDIPDPPDPPQIVDEGSTDLCPATADFVMGETQWLVWEDGTEDLMVAAYDVEPEAPYTILVDGIDLGTYAADEWGTLWVSFSSNPEFDDQVQLPSAVQPVSGIDVVQVVDQDGATVVAGSFVEPCSVEWEYDADSTGLCGVDGYPVGDAWWGIETINGYTIDESLWVIFWQAADGATYTVEIDGVDLGEMTAMEAWDGYVYVLGLGEAGDGPVPDELSPVSGIDGVRILDESGVEVAAGSFSAPCGGDQDPGGNGNGPMYHGGKTGSN